MILIDFISFLPENYRYPKSHDHPVSPATQGTFLGCQLQMGHYGSLKSGSQRDPGHIPPG